MFNFTCPICKKQIQLEARPEEGQHVLCPYCHRKFSYKNKTLRLISLVIIFLLIISTCIFVVFKTTSAHRKELVQQVEKDREIKVQEVCGIDENDRIKKERWIYEKSKRWYEGQLRYNDLREITYIENDYGIFLMLVSNNRPVQFNITVDKITGTLTRPGGMVDGLAEELLSVRKLIYLYEMREKIGEFSDE